MAWHVHQQQPEVSGQQREDIQWRCRQGRSPHDPAQESGYADPAKRAGDVQQLSPIKGAATTCGNDGDTSTALAQNEGPDGNCVHQIREGNDGTHHYGDTLVVHYRRDIK